MIMPPDATTSAQTAGRALLTVRLDQFVLQQHNSAHDLFSRCFMGGTLRGTGIFAWVCGSFLQQRRNHPQ